MTIKSVIYKLLKFSNDVNAIQRSIKTKSARPVGRRVARRVYGKATGRLARKLFG